MGNCFRICQSYIISYNFVIRALFIENTQQVRLPCEGEELSLSLVDIRENAIKASGKLGGVAGVLQGVTQNNQDTSIQNRQVESALVVFLNMPPAINLYNQTKHCYTLSTSYRKSKTTCCDNFMSQKAGLLSGSINIINLKHFLKLGYDKFV